MSGATGCGPRCGADADASEAMEMSSQSSVLLRQHFVPGTRGKAKASEAEVDGCMLSMGLHLSPNLKGVWSGTHENVSV